MEGLKNHLFSPTSIEIETLLNLETNKKCISEPKVDSGRDQDNILCKDMTHIAIIKSLIGCPVQDVV